MGDYVRYSKIDGSIDGVCSFPESVLSRMEDTTTGYLPIEGVVHPNIEQTHEVDLQRKRIVRRKGIGEKVIELQDIFDLVKTQFLDDDLNEMVHHYLIQNRIPMKVSTWLKQNKNRLRRAAYPPIEDFLDAQVKIAGRLPGGEEQLKRYVRRCKEVKESINPQNK